MAACLKVTEDVCYFLKETLKALHECGLLDSYSVSHQLNNSFPTDLRLNSEIASHLYVVREELSKLSKKFSPSTSLRSISCLKSTGSNHIKKLSYLTTTVRPGSQDSLPEKIKLSEPSSTHINKIKDEDSNDCNLRLSDNGSFTSTNSQMDGTNESSPGCEAVDTIREDSNDNTSLRLENVPQVNSCLSVESSHRCMNPTPKSSEIVPFKDNISSQEYQCKKDLVAHEIEKDGFDDTKKKAVDESCDRCNKVFCDKQSLEAHRACHLPRKPFSCITCGMLFAQKSTRDNHLSQHTGSFNYSCKECPKAFVNQSKLNFHMQQHKQPRHICEYCGKTFFRKDVLEKHLKRHYRSVNNVCVICGKAFRCSSFLRRHELRNHRDLVSHTCMQCEASFNSKQFLEKHMETEGHSKIPSQTRKVVEKGNPKTVNTPGAKVVGNPEQSFSCSECPRTYKYKHNLRVHEKSHQKLSVEVSKPYKCPDCVKRFSKKFRLEVHLKRHKQAPDFSCEICGQRFYRKEVLKNHIFLHSNQRPHKCSHCDRTFASKTNLTVHLSSHNTPYQDNSQGNLVCAFCQHKFKRKASLETHMKAHRGEFQYGCHICGKKFVRKGHYEGHLRSHSNDRPHLCPVCEKGFKEKKHRRDHLRRMHPNEFNLDTLFASITTEDVQIADTITASEQQSDAISSQ